MYVHVTIFLTVTEIIVSFCCPVYLTTSTNSLISRESTVNINWGPDCNNPPAKIRIYSDNPYLKEIPAVQEINPNNLNAGRVETKIKLGELKIPSKWNRNSESFELIDSQDDSNCLNFYVLSFNQSNHVTNFDCMKIKPQWMTKSTELWSFPLKELFIPGSQCSACYMTRSNRRRNNLKSLGVFRQKFDVWQQLLFGIRYLDFSVGYFRSFHEVLDIKGRFWVFNKDHEITPIFPILEDIRQFVEMSREIVILDFRNFTYGFHENSGAHDIFKKLLHNTFGHTAVMNTQNGANSFDFTIQYLRSASKYLLILYNYDDLKIVKERNETILWPAWKRSEIKTNENVVKYMSSEFSKKYRLVDKNDDGWILGLDYDENSLDEIEKINSQVISSLNGPWSLKTNVVSLEFPLTTNLIDISLNVNHQKALAKQNFIVIDL